jgi:MFS transporter, FSR family, fosmidomycin resistance protein
MLSYGQNGRVFWTLAAAHLINDSYVFFLPTLLPLLLPSLDISLTAAGLAVGLYQVTSSVTQPLLGHLADRYPLRWLAWLGLAATAIGAGGIGVAPNYWVLLALLILGALGTSAFHPVATATISDNRRRPARPDDVDLHHGWQPRAGRRAGGVAVRVAIVGAGH